MQSTCYSCQILIQHKFPDKFFKNPEVSNFMKFCPVGAKLFHVDRLVNRQMDSCDEALSCFSQFCKCVKFRAVDTED